VTLKNSFICTKLWYEYKICENESFGFFKKLLVLNSFDVVYV